MPRVGQIDGMVFYIYYAEHVPPHVHALCAEHEASIAIATCEVIEGSLPAAQLKRARVGAR